MQALQFSETGTLDSLQVRDVPRPVPGPGEILIEVRATGINPSDLKNVLGSFPYTTAPRIPGRDFFVFLVSGPPELQGKAVWGGTGKGFGFYRDGCHAQYVLVPADAVAPMPASLSFSQAATCGVPFITAWDALERSQVKAGTRLLIMGAGAVAVDVAFGYINRYLPMSMQVVPGSVGAGDAVKAVLTVALGKLLSGPTRGLSQKAAMGSLVVQMRDITMKVLPASITTPAVGFYNPGRVVPGAGARATGNMRAIANGGTGATGGVGMYTTGNSPLLGRGVGMYTGGASPLLAGRGGFRR